MAKIQAKYLVDEHGDRTAVVLPLEEYQDLLDDIHDLAVVAERKEEQTISLTDLKKRLKADGLL